MLHKLRKRYNAVKQGYGLEGTKSEAWPVRVRRSCVTALERGAPRQCATRARGPAGPTVRNRPCSATTVLTKATRIGHQTVSYLGCGNGTQRAAILPRSFCSSVNGNLRNCIIDGVKRKPPISLRSRCHKAHTILLSNYRRSLGRYSSLAD
jgi:hypothetical protein